MKKKLIIKTEVVRVLSHKIAAARGGVPASEAATCAPSGIHTCAAACVPF